MYPMPPLEVWIQVKNYYPLGTKTEREFNCDSIVWSTVVTAFYLEMKHYILKWEENNDDTENKIIIRVDR